MSASSFAILPFSSNFLLRNTIPAATAATAAAIAAKIGLATMKPLTALAAVLNPFAIPLSEMVATFPPFAMLFSAFDTPFAAALTDASSAVALPDFTSMSIVFLSGMVSIDAFNASVPTTLAVADSPTERKAVFNPLRLLSALSSELKP